MILLQKHVNLDTYTCNTTQILISGSPISFWQFGNSHFSGEVIVLIAF